MPEQTRRAYSIKPQDFIPFVGSFIYESRNLKEGEEECTFQQYVEQYGKFTLIGVGLTVLNCVTGMACLYSAFRGLESMIQ